MRRAKGFTIIELLVAMLLSAMLTTSVYRLMAGGARIFNKVQTRSNLQDQGLVALSRLAADIRAASWNTVTVRTQNDQGPVAVSMAGPSLGNAPRPFVVYYFDTVQHELIRGEATCPSGTRFDAVQLALAIHQGLVNPLAVARHVTQVVITPSTFPSTHAQTESIHATLWMSPSTATSTASLEVMSVASAPRN